MIVLVFQPTISSALSWTTRGSRSLPHGLIPMIGLPIRRANAISQSIQPLRAEYIPATTSITFAARI